MPDVTEAIPTPSPPPLVRRRTIRLKAPIRQSKISSTTPTVSSAASSMTWQFRNTKNFSGFIQIPPIARPLFSTWVRPIARSSARPRRATSFQTVLRDFSDGELAGPASYGLAEISFNEKDYASALPLFHRAAAKVKAPALALSARYFEARCLENLDRKDEARAVYEQVIEVKNPNPFRDDSRLAAGSIFLATGRKSDALKQFEALAGETNKPPLKAEATVRAGLVALDLAQDEKGKPDQAMTAKATALLQKGRTLPEGGRWNGIATARFAAARVSGGPVCAGGG